MSPIRASQPEQYFRITGMDCAEEVAILKREVGPVVGGEDKLAFDILNGRMAVAATDTNAQAVIKAVARTGMRATVWRKNEVAHDESRLWERHGRTIATIASGALAAAAVIVHAAIAGNFVEAFGLSEKAATPPIARFLYGLSVLTGVLYFLPKAWYSAIKLRPDMNLLMVVAVTGAIGIGEWSEAATVAFLFSLSLLLESWSIGRARRAIGALMDLTPTTVRIIEDASVEREVSAQEVSPGTVILVRPGERIPLDGNVMTGESDVDQSPITGESIPVPKASGDNVFAGTINGDGALQIQSTKPAAETTLARIIRMVGEAQSRRAPSEQWVERFARVYTPAVMVLALTVCVLPPLLFEGSWQAWLYNALVLLVIACPCALVISTPVSIAAAIAAAARHGVLVKGGVYVEAPANLKAIALDKTGTLTVGKPQVVQVIPLAGHSEVELLERVSSLESHSDHPLAVAIVQYVLERGIRPQRAEDFKILQGKGATGRFDGREFWLGSHRYLEERQQETPELHQQLEALSSAGRTVVVVGNESHVCGLIALADQVRPNTRVVLEALYQLGVQQLVMLTGDNRPTAEVIAKETGIADVRAELLPADKVRIVEELVEKRGHVAMIGDGVNDAPAMGRASLGIAMGAVGSDAAIETADIALMSDDLSKVPWLIGHSRRTVSIIQQNIVAALAVKAVFLLLTLVGHASLWTAIAADMGVSLLVILNGLRLLR